MVTCCINNAMLSQSVSLVLCVSQRDSIFLPFVILKDEADVGMHNAEFMGCRHAVKQGFIYQKCRMKLNSLETSTYLLRSVRIPIKVRAGRPKNRGFVLDRGKDYCLLHSMQTASRIHPDSCPIDIGDLSPRPRRPKRQGDLSRPSSTKIKHIYSHTPGGN
jgi:hypothetical protein